MVLLWFVEYIYLKDKNSCNKSKYGFLRNNGANTMVSQSPPFGLLLDINASLALGHDPACE